jgi:hypothetical protein
MPKAGSSAQKTKFEKDKSKGKSKGKDKGKRQEKKKVVESESESEDKAHREQYEASSEVKIIRDGILPMNLQFDTEYAGLQKEVASLEVQLADWEKDSEGSKVAEEEKPEPGEWHPVWVAIYAGEHRAAYKHWAIFVEDEQNASKSFICHVMGFSRNFRYEQKRRNAYESNKMIEMIQVSHVHRDDLKSLRSVAMAVPIKNEDPTWNCQDFVLQLLEALVVEELIDDDDVYQEGRKKAFLKMEGLV